MVSCNGHAAVLLPAVHVLDYEAAASPPLGHWLQHAPRGFAGNRDHQWKGEHVTCLRSGDQHVTDLGSCDHHVTDLGSCDRHVTYLKSSDHHLTNLGTGN